MTADEIDTRIAFVKLFDQTRDLMAESADQVRRSFDHRAAAARLTAEAALTGPDRLALPAPVRTAMAPEPVVDLTGVDPITERDLSIGTGVSLARIRKAITSKKIRTSKVKGQPRLLDIADVARFLHRHHGIAPSVLTEIHRSEEN